MQKSYRAPNPGEKRSWFLVDAKDRPLGRLAVVIANKLRAKDLPTYDPSVDAGAFVVVTDAAHHDEMIAFTSQLCHVIASAYAQDPRVKDAIGYSAGSYANMTRIATMDPSTWASLFLADRAALVDVLDGFIGRLGEFRDSLASSDRASLERLIAAGAAAKRAELAMRAGGRPD